MSLAVLTRARKASVDYKMFQTLEIKNFRCFKKVSIEKPNLSRINVVVGDSGSGKTVLLEALFSLCASDPVFIANTNLWRGIQKPFEPQASSLESLHSTWDDFFNQFDLSEDIYIGGADTDGKMRSLTISAMPKTPGLPMEAKKMISPTSMVFQWNTAGAGYSVEIEIGNTKRSGSPFAVPAIMITPQTLAPMVDLQNFSRITNRKEEFELQKELSTSFPGVIKIGIEDRGFGAKLMADVRNLKETIPIGLVSSGFNKYVSLLCAIAARPENAVFIDELENGFYYKALPNVWRLLVQWSKKYETQLFITTHSQECLSAMQESVEEHPEDFSLLRTVRQGDYSIVRHFSGKQIALNLENDTELR